MAEIAEGNLDLFPADDKLAQEVYIRVGQKMATVALGLSDGAAILSYARGETPLSKLDRTKLALLSCVSDTISAVYDRETARAFLRSSSPDLGDSSVLLEIATVNDESGPEVIKGLKLAVETFLD